ncbi:MAG: recombinase family protein [Oscillospiraceae bacterium]
MAKPLDPKAIEVKRQTGSEEPSAESKNAARCRTKFLITSVEMALLLSTAETAETARTPKLRVAAYCRVRTQEEQQVGSFDMQIHHFTKRIEANPQWELVEIYQDEGISATTVEKRLGFQKMIADAVDGKMT